MLNYNPSNGNQSFISKYEAFREGELTVNCIKVSTYMVDQNPLNHFIYRSIILSADKKIFLSVDTHSVSILLRAIRDSEMPMACCLPSVNF